MQYDNCLYYVLVKYENDADNGDDTDVGDAGHFFMPLLCLVRARYGFQHGTIMCVCAYI